MIESLLLTAAHVRTFAEQRPLTNASGFFFQREERLFLVTSRHVMIDEPSRHFPDRIEIELHVDPDDLGQSTGFSTPHIGMARVSGARGSIPPEKSTSRR